jgi:CheY-like chemotaxis protein
MSSQPDGGTSVLLVEDDEIVRRALKMVLEWEGYRVDCAANGQEGLDFLRAGGLPSIILLDMMMPVLDGKQFRQEQKGDPRFASIPLIVVSGAHFASTVDGDHLVRKPFEVQELLSAIRDHTTRASV